MSDLIERQVAIDSLHMHLMYRMGTDSNKKRLDDWINSLPSAQETHEERTKTHACDLIDRQAAIDVLAIGEEFLKRVLDEVDVVGYERKKYEWGLDLIKSYISDTKELPSAQPEPLTDKEQRIFLAAMGREESVCKEVDGNHVREAYEDTLMWVCKEIRRKVKGALWT